MGHKLVGSRGYQVLRCLLLGVAFGLSIYIIIIIIIIINIINNIIIIIIVIIYQSYTYLVFYLLRVYVSSLEKDVHSLG